MAPSINEEKQQDKKSTIETQTDNETAAVAPASPEESNSSSKSAEPTKKKKKKKKVSSGAVETQKAKDGSSAPETDAENGTDSKDEKSEKDGKTTQKDAAAADGGAEKESNAEPPKDLSSGPVVSSTKRTRPPYKYDPEKVTLRFLFANRDGLTVTVECKPNDTVGEVKGQLLSVWPEDLPSCSGGDQVRLICMGKGMLMPDSRTLKDCDVPVFKTHPTPVNVAVRPQSYDPASSKGGKDSNGRGGGSSGGSNQRTTEQSGQGCGCVIS